MEKNNTEYLVGKCLVSAPSMTEEPFAKSVIYICAHTKDGAMGFMINKKIKEFSFADLAIHLPIDFSKPVSPIDLYQGGPLDRVRGFVIHSTDYRKGEFIEPGGGIAISSSVDVLTDIAFGNGPKENIIALGYANWAPLQLEQEIVNDRWLVAPASPELIFRTKDEDKWQTALDTIGVDIARFSNTCGRA